MDPYDLTIARCAELMRRGEASSFELTGLFLQRAAELNSRLNAFLHLAGAPALAAARALDEERREGRDRGPLHGVPVALKDLFDTADMPTTAGSSHFAGRVPLEDAFIVRRLREAGAVIMGKTHLHEWAFGATNVNPQYGPCRNPWDLDRISGGSSGGTAAVVAAALVPCGTGTDTGGSIRIPAALCGVSGLKASYGRCSPRGVIPLAPSLDNPGPLARTAEDCAILLSVMAGYDAADPASRDVPAPDYLAALDGDVRGVRIGLPRSYFFEECDPEVVRVVEEAGRVLVREGAVLIAVDVPMAVEARMRNGVILQSEAAAFHRERLATARDGFGADVRALLDAGARLPAAAYEEAMSFRERFGRWLAEDLFTQVDCLLHPTTIAPAPLIAEAEDARSWLVRNTHPWNIAGTPVLAIPCGFTGAGLPIGMSLVGRMWWEPLLLRVGHAYQRLTDWHRRRPALG